MTIRRPDHQRLREGLGGKRTLIASRDNCDGRCRRYDGHTRPVRDPVDAGPDHRASGGTSGQKAAAVEGGNGGIVDMPGWLESRDRIAACVHGAGAKLELGAFGEHDHAIA
jgi:hypothetical protein